MHIFSVVTVLLTAMCGYRLKHSILTNDINSMHSIHSMHSNSILQTPETIIECSNEKALSEYIATEQMYFSTPYLSIDNISLSTYKCIDDGNIHNDLTMKYSIARDKVSWNIPHVFDNIFNIFHNIVDLVFQWYGYEKRNINELEYWILDQGSNKTSIVLHGLSLSWGLDHIMFLHYLAKRNNNIIFPIHKNIHFHTTDLPSDFTIDNHVILIEKYKEDDLSIFGESFGSAYLTLIAKNHYNVMNHVDKIIWMDPISLNILSNGLARYLSQDIFASTAWLSYDPITILLNNRNIFNTMLENINWLDWSLDSKVLLHYKDKCMIVFSKYEHIYKFNSSAPIFQDGCKVLVEPYFHGGTMLFPSNEIIEFIEK